MNNFPGPVVNMCKGPEAEAGLAHWNEVEEAKDEARQVPELDDTGPYKLKLKSLKFISSKVES